MKVKIYLVKNGVALFHFNMTCENVLQLAHRESVESLGVFVISQIFKSNSCHRLLSQLDTLAANRLLACNPAATSLLPAAAGAERVRTMKQRGSAGSRLQKSFSRRGMVTSSHVSSSYSV